MGGAVPSPDPEEPTVDTDPDPRPDLTAAQRIAIALGTAELPPVDGDRLDTAAEPQDPAFPDTPA